ncbi:hypothetical protein Pan216_24490 [Planctomycetes bacterium Pan216]|uniref:SGNH/GDSL hydrolase family protein n=1 Tax=Kolteria novifilia TaxID=2527975 RepID=A0A518B3L2_9BACT|nr:hypothetical protein Pan216_24490 [Planctomycetes bacterium Pan216]
MMHALLAALLLPLTIAADAKTDQKVYLIGNSLTWDTIPSKLDGDVQWHVDCGKSLPYIRDNPGMPCVKTSTLWPDGLKDKQYDIISVQPHYGSTLDEDVDVISKWVEMQPNAVFVIHTGWARQVSREKEYANGDTSGKMQHSPAYVDAVIAKLQKRFPDRKFKQTHAIDLIEIVADDIDSGKAPFSTTEDLYRDAIHMKQETGRYMMHNAMRRALGQPTSDAGFEKADPKVKKYLDSVIERQYSN